VNGRAYERDVEPRLTLADFLREDLGLKGTHLACEHGFCGSCNVFLDGEAVRSCLLFAIQAQGRSVQTVESLAGPAGELSVLQEAFMEHHALQCGFCTPAMLLTAQEYLRDNPGETDERAIREAISGVICRCTGYQQIVEAIQSVAARA
jgi:carbon-monoxide dehydrogenase small subunit